MDPQEIINIFIVETIKYGAKVVSEYARHNIGSIFRKALKYNTDPNKINKIDKYWQCCYVQNSQFCNIDSLQELFAMILAHKADRKGCITRKTLDIVSRLEADDARLYKNFCSFIWLIDCNTPIIYDLNDIILKKKGINFESI